MPINLWKPTESEINQLKKTISQGDRKDYIRVVEFTKKQEKKMERKALLKERKKNKNNKNSKVTKAKEYKTYIPEIKSQIKKRRYSHPLLGSKEYSKFYSSTAWRQLRYLALLNSGGKCCCCGASREDGAMLHVDHIKPRSCHPELELSLDNLQILCQDCNLGKGDWDDTSWVEHFKSI